MAWGKMLLKLFIQVVIMIELRCKLIFPGDLDTTVTKYLALSFL